MQQINYEAKWTFIQKQEQTMQIRINEVELNHVRQIKEYETLQYSKQYIYR